MRSIGAGRRRAGWTAVKSGYIGQSSIDAIVLLMLIGTRSSAGVGRTGTFIALSSLLVPPHHPSPPRSHLPDYLKLNDLPPEIADDKVAITVDQLREWRTTLVQTPDQLGLIYLILGL